MEQGLDPSQMFYDKAEARFVELGTPGSGSSMTKLPPNAKLPPLGNDASGALSGASSFDVNGPVKEISEKDRAERKKAEVKAQKAEAKAQKAEAKAQRAEAKVQKAEAEAKAKADDEDDEKQRKKRERRKAREQKKQSNVFTRWWKRNMEYEEVPLSMPAAKLAVKGLGLSNKQLLNMREKFDEIDLDGSGELNVEELLEYMEEKANPITDALFKLIDVDGDGNISFDEVVAVQTTYCMYTQDDILHVRAPSFGRCARHTLMRLSPPAPFPRAQFVFDIFDIDDSGNLNEKEFIELCKAVNRGKPVFPGNFNTAIREFDVNDDGLIDFEEFRQLHIRYPMLLYPAFRLQDKMQEMTLGSATWQNIMEQNARQLERERCPRELLARFSRAPCQPRALSPRYAKETGRKAKIPWTERGCAGKLRSLLSSKYHNKVNTVYIEQSRPRHAHMARVEAGERRDFVDKLIS